MARRSRCVRRRVARLAARHAVAGVVPPVKLRPSAMSKESAREPCGQRLRGSILGERCGEVVSHVCDGCGARICWLHTHASEAEDQDHCPGCAEKRRAVAFDALRGTFRGGGKLTDSAQLRALQAVLSRLSEQQPHRARGLRRVVEMLRRAWWRLLGG